jgi:hypothetical protein
LEGGICGRVFFYWLPKGHWWSETWDSRVPRTPELCGRLCSMFLEDLLLHWSQ